MKEEKYTLIPEGKHYRIKATKSFFIERIGRFIEKGSLGGVVYDSKTLSQKGTCWIFPLAAVSAHAQILDDAIICDHAQILDNVIVKDRAYIAGNAIIRNNACISNNAFITGKALVSDDATISDNAVVRDIANIKGNAKVSGNAVVYDSALVHKNARIAGKATIYGSARVAGSVFEGAICRGDCLIDEGAIIKGNSIVTGKVIIGKNIIVNTNKHPIGTNLFNDNEYFYELKSSISSPLEVNDANIYNYIILPINKMDYISFSAEKLYTSIGVLPCYMIPFHNEKNFWKYITKDMPAASQLKEDLNLEEKLFYNFLQEQQYDGVKKIITKSANAFLDYLIENNLEQKRKIILNNKTTLLSCCTKYLFAYFVNFVLCFYAKNNKLKNKAYQFTPLSLKVLLNCTYINIEEEKISSFSADFLYNQELIEMVCSVCKFSLAWKTSTISKLKSNKNILLLPRLTTSDF